ncbi:MAG: hypothetical protein ABL908_22435, partial [Hyphomicrobium sp.]
GDELTRCILRGAEQLRDTEEPARMRRQKRVGDGRNIEAVVRERMADRFITGTCAASLAPEHKKIAHGMEPIIHAGSTSDTQVARAPPSLLRRIGSSLVFSATRHAIIRSRDRSFPCVIHQMRFREPWHLLQMRSIGTGYQAETSSTSSLMELPHVAPNGAPQDSPAQVAHNSALLRWSVTCFDHTRDRPVAANQTPKDLTVLHKIVPDLQRDRVRNVAHAKCAERQSLHDATLAADVKPALRIRKHE